MLADDVKSGGGGTVFDGAFEETVYYPKIILDQLAAQGLDVADWPEAIPYEGQETSKALYAMGLPRRDNQTYF